MYAITAQMCCCQRADIAHLAAGGVGMIVKQAQSSQPAKQGCCEKCVAKAVSGPASGKTPVNSCNDCERCASGAFVETGTISRATLGADASADVETFVSWTLAWLAMTTHAKLHAAPVDAVDRGQVTLVRLHCALMV